MKNETNLETIGTFEAEHQEPVANVEENVEENVSLVVDDNDTNADLQGLINNRDALIREKRSAKDEAQGFKSQLEDMGNVNITLNKRIDDLLVDSLVNDIVRLIKPIKGAEAFVMDTIKKQISMSDDGDQRRALIENDLTTSDLAELFRTDNSSIVYGVDSSGANSHIKNIVGSTAKSTQTQFGLR